MSEPPYGSYDPYVFTQTEEQLAKQEFWQTIEEYIANAIEHAPLMGMVFGDAINVLTYAADLGPSAAEEAAIVDQYLSIFGVPAVQLAPVPLPSTAGLSLPDITVPITDLPGVTVTAPRQSPTPSPLAVPQLVSPGLETGALAAISPATGLAPLPLPGYGALPSPLTAPLIGTTPAPGYTSPVTGLGPDPNLADLTAPGASPLPETQPQAGTQPNQTDCQATSQKDKKKKQKKKTRNVCWKGTYEERKSGLLKFRRERITCR